MSIAAIARALKEAGCTSDQIVAGVEAAEADKTASDEIRRTKAREKKRLQRLSPGQRGTEGDRPGQVGTEAENELAPSLQKEETAPAHALIAPSSSLRSEENNLKPNPKGLAKAEQKASRKTRIAPDAQPSNADCVAADKAGLTQGQFRDEWVGFRDFHGAKGSTMASWSAAWRTWLRNSKRFGARAPPTQRMGGVATLLTEIYRREKNDRDHERPETSDYFGNVRRLSGAHGEVAGRCGDDDGGAPGDGASLFAVDRR